MLNELIIWWPMADTQVIQFRELVLLHQRVRGLLFTLLNGPKSSSFLCQTIQREKKSCDSLNILTRFAGSCDLLGHVTCWAIWLTGLCDLLGHVTYWVVWLTGWCDLLGDVTYWVMWLTGWCDLLGDVTYWVMWLTLGDVTYWVMWLTLGYVTYWVMWLTG